MIAGVNLTQTADVERPRQMDEEAGSSFFGFSGPGKRGAPGSGKCVYPWMAVVTH